MHQLLTAENFKSKLFEPSDTERPKFWIDVSKINPSFISIQQQRMQILEKACDGRTVETPFLNQLMAQSFYSKTYNVSAFFFLISNLNENQRGRKNLWF